MTPRQCEIAAESYAACLLAQAGYDVLVQYGANQPQYDLVAVEGTRFLPVSVKGSQDGGWMLAVKYKLKGMGVTYHQAIDSWLAAQRADAIFVFVQFLNVPLGEAPRLYVARLPEIAIHMKTQCDGRGHGALLKNFGDPRPGSRYTHRIPSYWLFSQQRIDSV
ncbi:MAG: hypothetical protein ABIN99_12430 [Nitrosospira sp.]